MNFGALPPTQHFSDDRYPLMMQNELWARRPCFIDHLFLLLTFDRFHAEIFSKIFHSLSTAAFAAGIFRARGRKICEPNCNAVKNSKKPSRMPVRSWKHLWILLCLAKLKKNSGSGYPELKTRLSCFLEADDESTRLRMGESLLTHHEDHIAAKGDNSSSSRSMKKIPVNFRAFSRWSFPLGHVCISFSLAFFPIFQISGHT